ncbi:MAG TPA: glycosyltransferase family 1 protein [Bacteroidia bacterium]|jgi:glycosyltransferase involved in cell wall biosynthesis|nr:glycosyltransferase family 1 protein [Bacteroidia bacterium]
MKIVVNTRLLLPNKLEGIGWFTYEALKRITRAHPEHHFIFLFDRNFDEEFIFSDNVTPLILSPPARHPILFYIWFEWSVAGFLNKYKPDLFLSPDGYLSLRTKCKQLAVIHDINFEHYPKDLSFIVHKYLTHFFPKFAKKASRIATVSDYSKNDIAATYQIDPQKIDVVYNGSNELYKPINSTLQEETKKKFSAGADYFLFVGALHPRKNIARLFQAFDNFKNKKSNPMKLVIVGEKYYWTAEIKQAYINMKFKDDVVFTGRLSTDDLKLVLGSAFALTYVPYFEGFGIPILEAMNCDVPVITSNVTAMPEIAAGAALLVNPFDVDSIADALSDLYSDQQLRTQLIEKGRKRRLDFSWDKTAQALWESIEKCL